MEEHKQYKGSSGNEKYFCLMDFWVNDERTLYVLKVNFEDIMFTCKKESDGKTTSNIKAIAELLNEAATTLCLFNTNVAMKHMRGEKSLFDGLSKVYPNTQEGLNQIYFDRTTYKAEAEDPRAWDEGFRAWDKTCASLIKKAEID